ncbi:MAG: DUF1858 domain-containing protein [Candidatus Tectomicrobia bacterium]|nr:DUF1858 domain-containing protein [Candidatus Tectomicrobia bacterium]
MHEPTPSRAPKPPITKTMLLADLLQHYPAARPIVAAYFGSECFTCPGTKIENLAFVAAMHNCAVDDFIRAVKQHLETR